MEQQLSAQQIFDRVATHLLTQGRRSLRFRPGSSLPEGCAYRGTEGLRCAIGCLISDESYDPRMEGRSVHYLVEDNAGRATFPDLEPLWPHYELLRRLQKVHDESEPPFWLGQLRAIASEFGLSPSAVR